MLEYLKNESNKTLTENGAATLTTTGSDCLDLFSAIGGLRHAEESEIIKRFVRAYSEDRDLALKTLFFARDVRGGLGERRVFKVILNYLAHTSPEVVKKNLPYIPEYGRYDDLLTLLGTPCEAEAISHIKEQFEADMAALEGNLRVSLLGKWLPSVNASSEDTVKAGKKIARALGLDDASYRKSLTALRARIKIIENDLRTRNYTFSYEAQPSKALFKYRRAFVRNDKERYVSFLESVATGKAKMNAGTLLPYEIVNAVLNSSGYYYWEKRLSLSAEERMSINETWNNLPIYENAENAIAVVDTSGSMYTDASPSPASVALSLGLYFAQHNTGHFKNHFIEFSEHPILIELKGETFIDKLEYALSLNKVANTNIEAVFDLILRTAIKNKLPQSDLPSKLFIISDMEFDCCAENADMTNFECAKAKFESAGYVLPNVIFWNVASRHSHQPVSANEQGVALVSGCSPAIFSMAMSGDLAPYTFMVQVLNGARYKQIAA